MAAVLSQTQHNQLEPKSLPDALLPQPETTNLKADVQNAAAKLTFDPEALKKKYVEEREKRMRYNAGVEQYRSVGGDFAWLLNDPYVAEKAQREPIEQSVDAVVVGGGYGGQLVAIELLAKGITDIKIIEKGGDFGGTW